MICPVCEKQMIVLEMEGLELDHCMNCGGTWLDAEEIEWLDELAGVAPGAVTAALAGATTRKNPNRRCPRCRKKMAVVTLGNSPGVEVDRCTRGHGLWMDRGELRAIVQAFGGGRQSDETTALAQRLGDFFRSEFETSKKGDSA